MREEIQNTKNEAFAQISTAKNLEEVESLRIIYLGRKGKLSLFTRKLKELDLKDKRDIGRLINQTKNIILKLLTTQKNKIKESVREWFDPTIPGDFPKIGHTHLISQEIEEISKIFERIGFIRMRYPEVEWDWYAFGSLNFTPDHPARDEWETFLVDAPKNKKFGAMLLTPHTSSGQIREMQRVKKPPIRMINIGKCYRRQSDASHYPMFHQFEGLVIDRGINITHLKGTLDYFAEQFYGKGIKTRIRPYTFPFTEPSFEVDITCTICHGKGCKVCREGWVEIGGAGMVHPNVLKNGGLDPKKYTGFAFGWGVERVLMMKQNLKIPDIRVLYSTNLNYLKQF